METMHFTRAMQKKQDDFIAKIDKMVTADNIKEKINELKEAADSRKPSTAAELRKMLKECGINNLAYETSYVYYEKIVNDERNKNFFMDSDDINVEILKIMFENFGDYPSSSDYMLRIVNSLSDPNDHWENDTLRLRILKQFIKYTNCLTYYIMENTEKPEQVMVYNGIGHIKKHIKNKCKGADTKELYKYADYVDDSIFDCLNDERTTEVKLKYDGTYGIIKLADDLAKGNFKSQGSTRRDLYMFAIAYNMTYSADPDNIIERSDIDRKLFKDYFTSTLMRFITDQDEKSNPDFGNIPTGQGINYKNFAEMIYLYYISKDLEPVEKLRRANEMIKRIKVITQNQENSKQPVSRSTTMYIDSFNDKLMNMSEDDFEDTIFSNYDCSTKTDNSYVNPFHVQHFQKKAIKIYQDLINEIKKAVKKININNAIESRNTAANGNGTDSNGSDKYNDDDAFKDCIYGLWYKDKFETIREILANNCRSDNPEKIERYINFLKNLDYLMSAELKVPKNEKEQYSNITRTDIVKAFYYYYITNCSKNKSLKEVFNDFKALNTRMEELNFQDINPKNIFDIAVIFSAYAYINY